jgi:hypothetical protein
MAKTHTSDFFIAGGTLSPDNLSYVRRPADEQLFKLALASEFCYVLTPRQMGKSSLMVHTAWRLKERGVSTAIVDLTKIGIVGADQWYLGLLTQLKTELGLSVDPLAWWQGNAILGRVQRFTDFLCDVVLTEIKRQVVIFIDEIDTTLKLDFTDDFFAAIRAIYNARADDPEFERLTFSLLGVATPANLVKDSTRTPFNIGYEIKLQEFSRSEAVVLQHGLEAANPNRGKTVFSRIYYWTNGHPYLTQKLCLSFLETEDDDWNDERVDRLVERLFLSEDTGKETNLQSVHDALQSYSKRRNLLTIYRQVYDGKSVADDDRSLDKNYLKLIGLVRSENGVLKVRNRIYRYVFNQDWVKTKIPHDWTRNIAISLLGIALLLLGLLGFLILTHTPQVVNGDFEKGFTNWEKEGVLPVTIVCESDFEEDMGNPFLDCAARIGDPHFPSKRPNSVPMGRGTMYQSIRVPTAVSSHLVFDYQFCSYDAERYDSLEVAVNNVNVPIWKIGNTTRTYPKCFYKQGEVIDLSEYRGEDIILYFSVWNTDLPCYNSWAYIDQIKLKRNR